MNAHQLKKSILQYAIEGKLVKQDSSDAPSSALLKQISEQKEKMVKEKIIKKEKSLPLITEEETPFDIPDTWELVRLKSISTFGNFNQASPEKINNDDWVLDLEEIEKNTGRILEQKSASEKMIKSNKYKFNQNDVLYGKLRPYLNKVTIAPHEGYCTTEIFPITLLEGVYPKYIQYVLMSPYFLNYAHSLSYGVKMPRLGTTQIANTVIPLPPTNEQLKIVDAIEELFFKIDSYDTHYLELDSLSKRFPKNLEKSILQYAVEGKLVEQDTADEPASELLKRISEQKEQMVKEKVIKKEKPLPPITEEEIPFDIPEMWQWVRLKNISTFGNFNQASPEKINPDDWVLDLEEIEKNTGRILEQKTASEKTIKSNKYKFNQNDVLYGKLRPYLNKVTIAPHEGYCTTEIFPITLIKGVYPKYIQYVLMSPYFLNYAHSLSYGVKMPRLGTTQIANALIPLPPANEQIKIVEKIEEMIKPVRNLSLLNEG
ncbi:restriction endonuclease subunit S [Exiguobacterium mexicanum]|uniref:restriction endonuclease subunit S n=1 Tax=Exiguobacterium mexicanum TaxID=340146 RepID=UPI0037BF17D1